MARLRWRGLRQVTHWSGQFVAVTTAQHSLDPPLGFIEVQPPLPNGVRDRLQGLLPLEIRSEHRVRLPVVPAGGAVPYARGVVPGQPVEVPAGAAGWLPVLPARFEPSAVSQADQDLVQRARPEPRLPCDVVAVAPPLRPGAQHRQDRQRLCGQLTVANHGVKSI